MADMYWARLARVVPPRAGAINAGAPRAIVCTQSSVAVELDTDIFTFPLQNGQANGSATPGGYGRALVRFHAESNDIWVGFGQGPGVVANSAATTGNTVCAHIPVNQDRDWEIDPNIDKWVCARTQNGAGLTATLRYQIVSFPTVSPGGAG
jgi:hypothetical protein